MPYRHPIGKDEHKGQIKGAGEGFKGAKQEIYDAASYIRRTMRKDTPVTKAEWKAFLGEINTFLIGALDSIEDGEACLADALKLIERAPEPVKKDV